MERRPGKLSPLSMKCKFLSYNANARTYRVLNQDTGRILVSRDVVFNEQDVIDYENDSDSMIDFIPPPPFGY